MADFKYFLLLAIVVYFIVKIATKNTKYETYAKTNETSSNFGIKWFIGIFIVALVGVFFALSYHFIPSRGKMFPKENLSLNNTILEENDINNLIEKYNNSSFVEKTIMRNDPLVRILLQNGIIIERNKNTNGN